MITRVLSDIFFGAKETEIGYTLVSATYVGG
jgi:hypothetical protein